MKDLLRRLTQRCAAKLLARNTAASFLTFGLDVAVLWLLVDYAGFGRIPSAALAFLLAMTLHYVLSRIWVFKGSGRNVASGYLYFLVNAGIGLVVTLAVFAALLEFTGLYYLIARVIASVIAGLLVFLLNAVFNFKAV